ncbi:MAG: helix-turn-helix transcriptional regulator [Lachnospiraceae bacterium]|nr:helix-turn-helix transcriptional regulator [Lachnospiraceae bacterium]
MDTKQIGRFLKELRKSENMTQEELGDRVGVTNKTISKWENGNYMPPIDVLMLLSEIYGVSINEILNGRRLEDA